MPGLPRPRRFEGARCLAACRSAGLVHDSPFCDLDRHPRARMPPDLPSAGERGLGARRVERAERSALGARRGRRVAGRPRFADTVTRVWEEPGTTEIRFASEEGGSRVRIEVSELEDWPLHGPVNGMLVQRAEADRHLVATALLAALRSVEERTPRTGEVAGWGSFPSAVLRRLTPDRPDMRSLPRPWRDARGQARFEKELRSEVGLRHPLRGVSATVLAVNGDTGDCLFELATGPDVLAIVRLTWSGRRENCALSPSTELFAD